MLSQKSIADGLKPLSSGRENIAHDALAMLPWNTILRMGFSLVRYRNSNGSRFGIHIEIQLYEEDLIVCCIRSST